MINILCTQYGFSDMAVERETLKAHLGDVNLIIVKGTESPDALAKLAETDVVLMGADQKFGTELLARAPKLKHISVVGVGYNGVDTDACAARGIWVSNVPDYGTEEVSNHALALLLNLARGIWPSARAMRDGAWNPAVIRPVQRLSTQTAGIIGCGRIGSAMARKCAALGMRVLATDPYIADEAFVAAGATQVDLETLLRESDYISLHSLLNEGNMHLLNARTLALMKPSACIVNTARGPLIDETALLAALDAGSIRAAALDVYSIENQPMFDDPVLARLLKHERCICTPHTAYYSEQGLHDMRVKCAMNIIKRITVGRPNTPVNQPVGV